MKKKLLAGLALASCAVMALAGVGCNGGGSGTRRGKVQITVWAVSDKNNRTEMNALEKAFNESNDRYFAKIIAKPAGFSSSIDGTLRGNSAPNVVQIEDERYFKGYVDQKLITNLDEYFVDKTENGEVVRAASTLDLSDIWETAVARYRYNPDTGYSGGNEPLYGLPNGIAPSVMYYNEDALKENGINVISIAEEDIAGTKYLPHGYYVYDEAPATGLTAKGGKYHVFNNKIPMNWDELVSISKLFTRSYAEGAGSPTTFGFYNEWRFSFGWSVGGDCLEWDEEKDQYVFALGEETANYLVTGKDVITVNGTQYKEGEILSYPDKHFVEDALAAGSGANYDAVRGYVEGKQLYALPSIRDAFKLFLSLSQEKGKPVTEEEYGLQISPTPDIIGNKSKSNLLTSNEVAFVVEGYNSARELGRLMQTAKKNWNIAPLYQYREYNDDGTLKTVNGTEVKGKMSAHSGTVCWAIPQNAKAKDGAFQFIEFMAGPEAQKVMMKTNQSLPNQKSVAYSDEYLNMTDNYICSNKEAILMQTANSSVGDWSYLENGSWVNVWANVLNTDVRNGKMTLDEFFRHDCIEKTNAALKLMHAKKFNG